MKTAFGIFWHDLRRLARNPLAIAVVIGVIVLSSACAWYAIAASWNPYANAGSLKIAVVNEDAGVDAGDGKYAALAEAQGDGRIDLGSLIVDALGDDESFDWRFVDAAEGSAGLESGEYYAQFVVPETFTEDFLSVVGGSPVHPTIEYWTNGKHAALALEAADAGAGVVDAALNRAFSEVLSAATSDVLKGVASEAGKTGTKTRSTGQSNLGSATSNVASAVGKMSQVEKAIDQWGTKAASSRSSLDALKSSLPGLRSSLDAASTQLEDVRSAVHDAESAYAGTISTTSKGLPKAMADASKTIKDAVEAIDASQGQIAQSTSEAKRVLQVIDGLVSTLRSLGADSDKLDDLASENAKLLDELNKIETAGSDVDNAAEQAKSAADSAASDIDDEVSNLQTQKGTFSKDILPQLDSSVDSLVIALGSLDGAVGSLDGQVDQAKSLLEGLSETLGQAKGSLLGVKSLLDAAGESLRDARSDLASVADSELTSRIAKLVDIDARSYGAAASPVTAKLSPAYALNSYGAGMAPFYTSLAIWACCLMLAVVLKLEVDPRTFGRVRPWQGFLGRMLLFALLAVALGVIVSAGDVAMGIEPVAPLSFVLAGIVTALCFASVVYALSVTFKHVGTALAAVLLVVQIPLASGMYPAQLMPSFSQALRSWMPFTHGMGAMREALAGFYGSAFAGELLWLLGCGAATLVIALVIRPGVANASGSLGRNLELAEVFAFTTGRSQVGSDERERSQVAVQPFGRDEVEQGALPADEGAVVGEGAFDHARPGDAGTDAVEGASVYVYGDSADPAASDFLEFSDVDLDDAEDWRNDAWGLASWNDDSDMDDEAGFDDDPSVRIKSDGDIEAGAEDVADEDGADSDGEPDAGEGAGAVDGFEGDNGGLS